ncbi:EF-hand domain-containing protein [Streptacidiphilus sp. PAMC 29251]
MHEKAVDRAQLVFDLLDADGNGLLEAEDFELMARRVIEAARDSDDAAKEALSVAFRRYWEALEAELDAHHDGRITFDEYHVSVLSPHLFDEPISEFAEALGALGHPAGDELVHRPVFVALMTAIGFDHANINTLFDAFGPNASDQIEASAWVEGIKDYYHPDKAGIHGDHLLVGSPGETA